MALFSVNADEVMSLLKLSVHSASASITPTAIKEPNDMYIFLHSQVTKEIFQVLWFVHFANGADNTVSNISMTHEIKEDEGFHLWISFGSGVKALP